MNAPDKTLRKAEFHLARGEYAQVIQLLSPQIFLFRSSPQYFFLIGMACLKTNDLGGAFSYLKRGEDVGKNQAPILQALAILYLRRQEEKEALQCLIHILEIDPQDTKAAKTLELIKLAPESTNWEELGQKGSLDSLLPGHPLWMRLNYTIVGIVSGLLVGIVVLATVIPLIVSLFTSINKIDLEPRPPLEGSISLEQQSPTLVPGTAPRYILNNQEIQDSVRKLQDHYREYRDNQARIEINRILGSNASEQSKTTVASLLVNLRKPDFTKFRDPIEYSQVQTDPALHEGIFVRWQGRVSAYQRSNTSISFELLLGYNTSPVAEGTIRVQTLVPQALQDGDNVELIGQVLLDPTDPNGFTLQASDLRLLAPSTN